MAIYLLDLPTPSGVVLLPISQAMLDALRAIRLASLDTPKSVDPRHQEQG